MVHEIWNKIDYIIRKTEAGYEKSYYYDDDKYDDKEKIARILFTVLWKTTFKWLLPETALYGSNKILCASYCSMC